MEKGGFIKLNFHIDSNGLYLADSESESKYNKLKPGTYSFDVKLNQNYRLHKKIFAFFAFCTTHYYGDSEAAKDEFNTKFVRNKLTVFAGYYKQQWTRDGDKFELIPLSLSYEKMSPEERGDFYKRIVDAALKHVFDRTNDEEILKQLIGWF